MITKKLISIQILAHINKLHYAQDEHYMQFVQNCEIASFKVFYYMIKKFDDDQHVQVHEYGKLHSRLYFLLFCIFFFWHRTLIYIKCLQYLEKVIYPHGMSGNTLYSSRKTGKKVLNVRIEQYRIVIFCKSIFSSFYIKNLSIERT